MVKDDAGVLWVDGELVPASEARVDPRDRGYALGDGLFETMRAREGRLPWGGGDRALRYPGRRSASRGDHETLETNELSEAVIRLTVSRGVPTVCGLLPEPKPAPTLMIGVQSFAGYPSSLYVRGMRAITSLIPRNEPSPLARIKSLSYLEDVLARREADARRGRGAPFSIRPDGLACASAANLFFVLDGALLTPDSESGILPGTMREILMAELAPRMGLTAARRAVRPDEMSAAEEAFLTSALLSFILLTEVGGLSVGTGEPGPISSDLRAEVERALASGGPL